MLFDVFVTNPICLVG